MTAGTIGDGFERTQFYNSRGRGNRFTRACPVQRLLSYTYEPVEAFGESEPVGSIGGQKKYTLELTRLYATDAALSDGINFYDLHDFSLVICKPDRKIIYSGCQWSGIEESGQLDAMVAEKITVVAAHRIETRA
jgi:hypothetical protein